MNINATLIGQMITFLLFVWFTYKFVWPPLTTALKDRQAKIADGLAAAERGHVELAKAQEQVSLMLKESKNDASAIVLQAKKEADTVVESARHQAHEEGQRIIQQAQAEVIHMVEQAKESLRHQVAMIAIAGAEKVLGRTVDPQAHAAMLEKLAQEI